MHHHLPPSACSPSPTQAPSPLLRRYAVWLALGLACTGAWANGEKIGTVDTAFKLIGRDHDILVEAYADPSALGVTC